MPSWEIVLLRLLCAGAFGYLVARVMRAVTSPTKIETKYTYAAPTIKHSAPQRLIRYSRLCSSCHIKGSPKVCAIVEKSKCDECKKK